MSASHTRPSEQPILDDLRTDSPSAEGGAHLRAPLPTLGARGRAVQVPTGRRGLSGGLLITLLLLVALGLVEWTLWQENTTLQAENAALRAGLGGADRREHDLQTLLDGQKSTLSQQNSTLTGQDASLAAQQEQIAALARDVADLKERAATIARHNAQLREVLGLDANSELPPVVNDSTPTPGPVGPDGLLPDLPPTVLPSPTSAPGGQGGEEPPSSADPLDRLSQGDIDRLLVSFQGDVAALRDALGRYEALMGTLDSSTADRLAEWVRVADEPPAGADSPEVTTALEVIAAAPAPAAPPPAASTAPQKVVRSSIPAGLPFYGYISSPFGWRNSPFTPGAHTYHKGMDIVAPIGTPVRATQGGTVIIAGWTDWYGKTVMIDHGKGWVTIYGHLSKIKVSVGDDVDAEQVVALSGNTGPSTGPHIHYEIRHNGTPVNPANYR